MNLPFSAVLLAGGKSSRMGRNKALITIGGEPLWRRQLRILRALQPHHLFITGPFREEGAISLVDAVPGIGPFGGLLAALRRCSTPRLLALAVDLPKMTSGYLAELLCTPGGIVPRGQPLAGVYPVEALPLAERCFASQNYAMQEFARRCVDEGFVSSREIAPADERFFFNLNTPEDVLALAHD